MGFEYGCIGEVLKHSFSREIHGKLGDYKYELLELTRDELKSFMEKREFKAINVTLPYKEAVIPYLDEIDGRAREIGAVNTVINRGGRLFGYNTDFFGMDALTQKNNISLLEKKVAILGTGGTSKTALAVAEAGGAAEVFKVSRSGRDGAITYEELYERHSDTDVIINTTPAGMFPNVFDCPVDLNRFPSLYAVIDAVYNPLRTPLILGALEHGAIAEGGLYMLVAQAFRAAELFLGEKIERTRLDEIFTQMVKKKESIVLIGMPASGKSTIGRIIAKSLSRPFIDTDTLTAEREGKSIPEIFEQCGEDYFRDAESAAVKIAAAECGAVIATGGGAILREENVKALRENGRIYFIDRPKEKLVPTLDRPLSSTKEAIEKRFAERYPIYCNTADVIIDASGTAEKCAQMITEDFLK